MVKEQVHVAINLEETGKRIRRLIEASGYTVRDIQRSMGFSTPQAVYNWMAGKSLPMMDNLVILSRVLHVTIDEILVIEDDIEDVAETEETARKPYMPRPP